LVPSPGRFKASKRLGRRFFSGSALEVAPAMLNKLVVRADGRVARLVEVEAYRGQADPASHAYRGPTARNRSMFGPPGHLYVYLSYGMHFCANVVCAPTGIAEAVLLRAAEPLSGLEIMHREHSSARARGRRVTPREQDLCRGPGRLCRAFGIDRSFDGSDLTSPSAIVWIADDGVPPPTVPVTTPRVGISVAAEWPWRFMVPGRRSGSRRATGQP
jgi:DNA-3-methyladenine glycosylase